MTKNWYPVIDYKRCVACMSCVEFCSHKVYGKKAGKPFIRYKEGCVDQCKGCEKICPEKAITHLSL